MKRAFSLIELSIVILIIGILIAGVTQASRLVAQFRIRTAQTLTQSSPVAGIKDLMLWYETTSSSSFDDIEAQDTSLVTNWYDINPQSPVKYPATGAGATRPTYVANGQNGLPLLSFDGSTTFMNVLNTTNYANFNPNGFTMFMVLKAFNTNSIPVAKGIGANNNEYFLFVDPGPTIRFGAHNISAVEQTTADSAATIGSLSVATAIYSSGSLFIGVNGTLGAGAATAGTMQTAIGTINIGRQNNGGFSNYCNCQIGEFIFFDRTLKTEERKAVEAYLGKKWGIKVS